MMTLLSALLSALLNAAVSLFRKSPEQRLGEAEVKNEALQKENEALRRGASIDAGPADTPDAVLEWLRDSAKGG